jgi:hypothetical protein
MEYTNVYKPQIELRAEVNTRSRNGEAAFLIDFALQELGDNDSNITYPKDSPVQTGLYIDPLVFETLQLRAERHHRPKGPEVVRLLAYAIETIANRQLDIIRRMVREDQSSQQNPDPETV